MSCQSLSLAAGDSDPLSAYHRAAASVHFAPGAGAEERKSSLECSLDYQQHGETDTDAAGWTSVRSGPMSRSAPAACPSTLSGGPTTHSTGSEGGAPARFPRLEECAHFHYERVRLGGLTLRAEPHVTPPQHNEEDAGWVTVSVRPHCEGGGSLPDEDPDRTEQADDCSCWLITRSAENFKMLDTMLHRCIYDRKVSGLPELSVGVDEARATGSEAYESLIADYLHHFSIIADDTINCGPILNWFQMDNKGHRLLVASEDCNSINTPAVAAAYSVRRYVSQARDEISFEVGDMISVIDMPGPSESTWWRGKRGFRVGFFPQQCVAVIGDKVPRNMKEPPPIVGSVAVAPIKPVLRKHGKLISLFRSFILSRPSRRALRQQGILRERVFGCDLGEHLLNSGHDVPLVLSCCAKIIEQYGCVDGIYRLSGASSTTQRLRIAFDEERLPPLDQAPQDVHAVASLLKMYFRELPNPLCTYQLYTCFVNAVQGVREQPVEPAEGTAEGEAQVAVQPRRLDDAEKLLRMRETVVKLPPPHYRTLAFLMRHLHHMSLLGASTGMTARNMAIVWAPNLLRSPIQQHALQGVAVQAVVTEFLICYAELIFSDDQQPIQLCQQSSGTSAVQSEQPDSLTSLDITDGHSSLVRRPKSLPLQTPTKLLSLEEARSKQQLRPSVSREPQYIEVGGGPNSLPRYHTIIQLPSGSAKRGLKRSPSGWRGLFFRASKHRPRPVPSVSSSGTSDDPSAMTASQIPTTAPPHHMVDATNGDGWLRAVVDDNVANVNCKEKDSTMIVEESRAARSCESLLSEGDSLPPLASQPDALTANHHNRSVSCDSYFEASLAELAGMRLRLTSQEREMDIFSEDDTTRQVWNRGEGSSADTSVEPSPTKLPRTTVTKVATPPSDTRKRTKIEEQLSDLLYIDCATPEHRARIDNSAHPGSSSPDNDGDAKRVCKETVSVRSSQGSGGNSPQPVTVRVKMRDRGSPRKSSKNGTSRHSHCGTPPSPKPSAAPQRHSTLIRVDWPNNDALQSLSLNCYAYSQLQSDSEGSLPMGESHDSLAKRLIESKESLMSRSNEQDGLSILNVTHVSTTPHKDNSEIKQNSNEHLKNDTEMCEMKSDESSEVLVGIVTKDVSNENLDGSFYQLRDENKGSQDCLKENRLSGHYTVDWSDGLMDSSMERSTLSSDMDKSFEKKEQGTDKNEYEDVSGVRTRNEISSSEEQHYDDVEDFSKNSEKQRGKEVNRENRCSITITPNEENFSQNMADSLEESLSPTNISYQNLNRLSNMSNDSGKVEASKESTPSYSSREQERTEEIYECFTFARPSYIHLASSSGGSNTPSSPPVKSPIKSTISITYKSPTKENKRIIKCEDITGTLDGNDEGLDEVYEVVQPIGETATVPENADASLPTQQAFQPNSLDENLISLDTPVQEVKNVISSKHSNEEEADIYNKVKFFRQSIHEVNSLILEPENEPKDSLVFDDSLEANVPENVENNHDLRQNSSTSDNSVASWYENVCFEVEKVPKQKALPHNTYENILIPDKADCKMTNDEPLVGMCLDRRLNSNKIEVKNRNTYENYKLPFSEQSERDSSRQEWGSVSLDYKNLQADETRNQPLLSLDISNKENTVDNGNIVSPDERNKSRRSSTNVRQLAHKFESPTENKGPFSFERSSRTNLSHTEKMSTLERMKEGVSQPFDRSKAASLCEGRNKLATTRIGPSVRARTTKLAKNCSNTRSLDENAFVKEFGRQILHKDHTSEREIGEEVFSVSDRRKSLEAGHPKSLNPPKRLPDLNLNLECDTMCATKRESLSLNLCDYSNERSMGEEESTEHYINRFVSITPTTENKISLVQARLSPKKNQRQKLSNMTDSQKDLSDELSSSENSLDRDKKDKLSRERIEKYKEERRMFLREKYSPHSFRGIGDLQLTCKTKNKGDDYEDITFEGVQLRNPGKVLERRNTADAAQRIKYSTSITSNKTGKSIEELSPKRSTETQMDVKNDDDLPKVMQVQRKFSLDGNQCQQPQRLGASWDSGKIGKGGSSMLSRTPEDQEVTEITKPVRPKNLGNFNVTGSSEEKLDSPKSEIVSGATVRKEKRSPSFNIRDMAAKFEQKSNPSN